MLWEDEYNMTRFYAANLIANLGPVESLQEIYLAFANNRINDHGLKMSITIYAGRLGKDCLLAEAMKIENAEVRQAVESLIRDVAGK